MRPARSTRQVPGQPGLLKRETWSWTRPKRKSYQLNFPSTSFCLFPFFLVLWGGGFSEALAVLKNDSVEQVGLELPASASWNYHDPQYLTGLSCWSPLATLNTMKQDRKVLSEGMTVNHLIYCFWLPNFQLTSVPKEMWKAKPKTNLS